MAALLLRTLLLYLLLLVVMRLSGKRQIGQLQLSELITTLLISEIATTPITAPHTPIENALLPILLILLLELICSYAVTRSHTCKRLLEGKPSLLIRRGRLMRRELAKQRIGLEELLSAMRLQGYPDPGEVSYAILEQNGQISVLGEEEADSFAFALIVDGKIDPAALRAAGRDENWLKNLLSSRGCRTDQVFLLTASASGRIFLALREED